MMFFFYLLLIKKMNVDEWHEKNYRIKTYDNSYLFRRYRIYLLENNLNYDEKQFKILQNAIKKKILEQAAKQVNRTEKINNDDVANPHNFYYRINRKYRTAVNNQLKNRIFSVSDSKPVKEEEIKSLSEETEVIKQIQDLNKKRKKAKNNNEIKEIDSELSNLEKTKDKLITELRTELSKTKDKELSQSSSDDDFPSNGLELSEPPSDDDLHSNGLELIEELSESPSDDDLHLNDNENEQRLIKDEYIKIQEPLDKNDNPPDENKKETRTICNYKIDGKRSQSKRSQRKRSQRKRSIRKRSQRKRSSKKKTKNVI